MYLKIRLQQLYATGQHAIGQIIIAARSSLIAASL